MNAYFQVINEENKTKLRLIPATDDGQGIDMSILMDYLNYNNNIFLHNGNFSI